MPVLQLTLYTFLHLLLEAVPLFLLGAVLGAALEAWLKPGWIEGWIGSGLTMNEKIKVERNPLFGD
jgi:uncharacterized membrane protein YraQ (UPF0718 family)